MNYFMIDIDLPENLDEHFMSLIPSQREQLAALMSQGVIISYSLALDRSKLWATIIAQSEEKVYEIIGTFPLIHYMTPTVYPLAFHNSTSNNFPVISLN